MLHERHTFFELWRKILLVKTPLLKWNRSHCIGFDHFDQLPNSILEILVHVMQHLCMLNLSKHHIFFNL